MKGTPFFRVGLATERPLLRRRISAFREVPRHSHASGPPVWQNPPGGSYQTGGRRIRVRACMGLRPGISGNRSPQRGRMGGEPGRENGGFGSRECVSGVTPRAGECGRGPGSRRDEWWLSLLTEPDQQQRI